MQRFIIEMGMGNDQYGQDYTKAAARAIEDAIRHSAIPLFSALDLSTDDMHLKVTIGAQEPEKVDCSSLYACLPRGKAEIGAVFGGLNVINPDNGNEMVIVSAAVEAHLDPAVVQAAARAVT